MLFKNPIIPGYNPDPSICRVGSDYYIVNSTFEFFPGVPVYHSKNLVNWELTGYCLDRRSQLELEDCRNSGGIYAPTIRYHKGMFYMITIKVILLFIQKILTANGLSQRGLTRGELTRHYSLMMMTNVIIVQRE